MSQENVAQIILKALNDLGFREQLYADPGKALASYELTEQERAEFNNMSHEAFDAYAAEVEQRVSKSGLLLLKESSEFITGATLRFR
jgi:hypothetical protein